MRYLITDGSIVLRLETNIEESSGFTVTSGAHPGLSVHAETLEEAFSDAREAMNDRMYAKPCEFPRL